MLGLVPVLLTSSQSKSEGRASELAEFSITLVRDGVAGSSSAGIGSMGEVLLRTASLFSLSRFFA